MTVKLIPVVVRLSRLQSTFKYRGGLLNPDAQYYVRRTTGNHNPMPLLIEARDTLHQRMA